MLNGDVIHLRLVNSDEVIGELEKVEDNLVYIKRPMIVDEREDSHSKNVNIVLTKYVLFNSNTSVPFKVEHIITRTNVLPEISTFYFNSIKYNEKFIEPLIVKDIQKTNDMIEEFLNYEEFLASEEAQLALNEDVTTIGLKPDEDDVRIILIPSSNTIH
jgi:hypothetical protein